MFLVILRILIAVTKQKLSQEREVLKLCNKERSLMDDLLTTKAEVEHLTEQLEVIFSLPLSYFGLFYATVSYLLKLNQTIYFN